MTTTITVNQEYANLVPSLKPEEYESLKESIKQNGLWVPIIVNSQGVILDGHHRYKACQELGIKEPKTMIKDFSDKLQEKMFVIDSNLQRRQLNNFQRTELALKSKSILEQIAKQNESLGGKGDRNLTPLGRVDEHIGQRAGVSRDTVRKVDIIVHKAPERVLQGLRTGDISINQAFEEYGIGNKRFAEIEHSLFRHLRDKEMPMFAELFGVGRMAKKTDKEIEDEIRKMEDESDKDILNDESMKNGTESYRECIKGIVCSLKEVREDCIKTAKNLADRAARVEQEFKKFSKLEKQGKDLNKHVGFRHDRWIMTVETDRSYQDIDEEGLMHTFKDKKSLLCDAYVTTEDLAYMRVFDMDADGEGGAAEKPSLPDISKYVASNLYSYINDKGEQYQLIDAVADHKTDHYRNLGRYVLESEDPETDRILGVKDKPDDPRIVDYKVLYESPKCTEQKEEYSDGDYY